jgi:SAM-dependent methyltransferase
MISRKNAYTTTFFGTYAEDSYRSAKTVLPVVHELIHPARIIDVGCGVGTWLRVWEELGAARILGVDGTYVDTEALLIDKCNFVSMELINPQPVAGAPFDLVQSLEVAEHLPPDAAARFIEFLCCLAPVVLFSAAIPGQGGTSHLNEQWPEYWAKLFRSNGYEVFDVIRPKVWDCQEVAYYYAQNAFLFADKEALRQFPSLQARTVLGESTQPLARVHPRKWEERVNSVLRFEQLVAAMPKSALMFAKRGLRRVRRALLHNPPVIFTKTVV